MRPTAGTGTLVVMAVVVIASIAFLLIINNPSLFFLVEFAVAIVLGL